MSQLSRFVPIKLYHDYRTIPFSAQDGCNSCFPRFEVADFVMTDPIFPILQAFYELDQGGGVEQETLLQRASQIVSGFSAPQYAATFRAALAKGNIQRLVPPRINYFAPTQPLPRFVISAHLDQRIQNANQVKFLLALVGGYKSPHFLRWFSL